MNLQKFSEDFSVEESKALADYISNGCPGLSKITDDKTFSWFQLYLSGKTYSEIAEITGDKRDLILYISNKLKWNEKRLKYYDDISSNITTKVSQAKIESMNTISTIVSGLNKYYEDIFNKYLKTKDKSIIDALDTKLLTQYHKSLDSLSDLMFDKAKDKKAPTVNVNIGSSAEIKKVDDNTIEVKDKSNILSDLLTALSDHKRSQSDKD